MDTDDLTEMAYQINEMKALDKESSNYKLLEDYTRWSPEDEL